METYVETWSVGVRFDCDHRCSHSVWREEVNGGEKAGLTDENVLF